MKLTDKAKKRLTIAGFGVMCVVLVIAIASRFVPEAPKEVSVQPSSAVSEEVSPSIPPAVEPGAAQASSVPTIDPSQAPSQPIDTGDSTGTEQSIQAEVTKPTEPPKEVLTDPSKTPDGEKVGKDQKPETNQSDTPKSGDKKDGKIYVPGFGWIDDNGGGGSGTTVGNPGDELTGNKVGSMD